MHSPHPDPSTASTPTTRELSFGTILTVALVGAMLMFLITVGVKAWVGYAQQQETQRKLTMSGPPREIIELREQQADRLTGGRKSLLDDRVRGIPIDVAMERVAASYGSSEPSGDRNGPSALPDPRVE